MRNMSLFILLLIVIGCEPTVDNEEAKQRASEFVKMFGKTWAEDEDYNKLNELFTENFYTISPSDSFRIEGRDKNVEAYKQFLESSDVLDYNFTDEDIQVYNSGNSAIVSLYYHMTMKVNTDTFSTSGRDMLILVKENNNWKIAADHFSTFPKK